MLRKLYFKPIIAGIIVFFASLIVDKLMGKSADYGYAFIVGIIFGILYFLVQFLLKYRIARLRKR